MATLVIGKEQYMLNPPINKIILDTDIGDDIDDAFALALCVRSPEIELLGITTVFRNAHQRAQMARALLDSYQSKVPVFAGVDQPLTQVVEQLLPPEIRAKEKKTADGKYYIPQFNEAMANIPVAALHAVDFIIDTVRQHPHEVILVPIGPLTNIALALRKAPDIIPLVKKVVMMGGYDQNKYPEWNIYCDPEAARIVYTSGITIEAVGLDVTLQVQLSSQDIQELRESQHSANQMIAQMMNKWFDHYQFKTPVMHDPLAVGTLLGSFVGFIPKLVEVQLNTMRGATLALEHPTATSSIVLVAQTVDKDRFLKLFKERVFTPQEVH
jgi:purine nucleosidase/pyrimidine-specific ribonucleoside hydrolase